MIDRSSRSTQRARLLVHKIRPFVPDPVRGVLRAVLVPMVRLLVRGAVFQLDVEPDDVFLASFPRSGNTWMRHMLTLVHPGLDPGAARDVHRVIPHVDLNPDLSETPRPRVIKTHTLFDARYPRMIYLLRDGRDATYSHYVFCQKEFGYRGSFRDFLAFNPHFPWKWHEHVASWISDEHTTPFLLVRFEDMVTDPELQLRSVIDFLGWEVGNEETRWAVAQSQIDQLRAREKAGVDLKHIGQGRVGAWRERYSEEELAFFMRFNAQELGRLRYLELSDVEAPEVSL